MYKRLAKQQRKTKDIKSLKIDRDKLKKFILKGYSIKEIASGYKLNYYSFLQHLKRNNLSYRKIKNELMKEALESKLSNHEIMKMANQTYSAIFYHKQKNKIKTIRTYKTDKRQLWNIEQINYLIANYRKLSVNQIALKLNKRPQTVRNKATALNLRKTSDYTKSKAIELFNQGLTRKQIASKLNLSYVRIYQVLRGVK